MKKFAIALLCTGILSGTAVAASPQPADHHAHDMGASMTAAGPMTDGIVRGIDLGPAP